MLVFDSFAQLKTFVDSVFDFLRSSPYRAPLPVPDVPPLDDTEKNIITSIYNSYKEKGATIKQIAGSFLHLLQLLVPSQNFIDIFKHLIYLEWMEHRIKPDPKQVKKIKLFYRDHIMHCANVCWVGHRLIFDLEEPFYHHIKSCLQKILPPECKTMLTDEDHWKGFIKITWYITAMIHDFGYPLELVKKKYISDELYLCSKNYLHARELGDYFDTHLSGCIPLFKKQVEKIDKKILDNPFRNCDVCHPIMGSLELLHFLKKNYRKLSGHKIIYRYIYQLAALGIFEHHKNGKIDFDLNPFGYILALADTIHEWHRYVCIGTSRASSAKLKFISPIIKVTIEKEATHLYRIKFRQNPQKARCKGWGADIFRDEKQKELKRLKIKTGLPRLIT